MPRGNVPAPQVQPVAHNLLDVVQVVNHQAGDEHWVSGLYWTPEITSYDVDTVDLDGANDDPVIAGTTFTADPALPLTTGFGILFKDLVHSPFGHVEDRRRRILEAAETMTSTAVEHELWKQFIASGVTPEAGGDETQLPSLLGALEQNLQKKIGAAGVIHVSRGIATRLAASRLVHLDGSRLVTTLGTPVVAGFGYSEAHMFASGPVTVHLGPVVVLDVFGQPTNDMITQAERTAGLVWDAETLVSVGVTL